MEQQVQLSTLQQMQIESDTCDESSWFNEDWYSSLSRSLLQESSYEMYKLHQLISKIYEENLGKCYLTNLSPAWNLMLYSFCDFSQDDTIFVVDQEQTGRRMIRYNEAYSPKVAVGECPVCCNSTELISNPCGHAFCFSCWISYMRVAHCDRSQYELFPMCQWDECFHRTNLMLMEQVWLRCPEMKQYFERLLCLKYSQKSDRVRLCSREGCNKAILINFTTDITIVCHCGNKLCRICGELDHFPLSCGDLRVWNKIAIECQNALNQIKQSLSLQLIQDCPDCKCPILKKGGCIHMTCVCKHQFCWICLKGWLGHTSFGMCQSITQREHVRKLKQQQRLLFQNKESYLTEVASISAEIERLDNIVLRLKSYNMQDINHKLGPYYILSNDLSKFKDIRQLLIDVIQLYRNSKIYIFFENNYSIWEDLSLLYQMALYLDDELFSKISTTINIEEQTIQILLYNGLTRNNEYTKNSINLFKNMPDINDTSSTLKKIYLQFKKRKIYESKERLIH